MQLNKESEAQTCDSNEMSVLPGTESAEPGVECSVNAAMRTSQCMQGPTFRLDRPTFTVLRDNELPKPGMVFGIDAEFVALAHADKVLQRCCKTNASDGSAHLRPHAQTWIV